MDDQEDEGNFDSSKFRSDVIERGVDEDNDGQHEAASDGDHEGGDDDGHDYDSSGNFYCSSENLNLSVEDVVASTIDRSSSVADRYSALSCFYIVRLLVNLRMRVVCIPPS